MERNDSMQFSKKATMFDEAVELILKHKSSRTSILQARLAIDYARAARIKRQIISAGIINLKMQKVGERS